MAAKKVTRSRFYGKLICSLVQLTICACLKDFASGNDAASSDEGRYRKVANAFGVGKSTVSVVVRIVCDVIPSPQYE